MPQPPGFVGISALPYTSESMIVHGTNSSLPYGNGPTAYIVQDVLLVAWYAGMRESVNNTVLLSWARLPPEVGGGDVLQWEGPHQLFPPVTGKLVRSASPLFPQPPGIGDENEAFFEAPSGMLYGVASSWDLFWRTNEGDGHLGLQIPLLRSIQCHKRTCVFGDIFWTAPQAPPGFEHWGFATLSTVDSRTRADGLAFLHDHFNTTVPAALLPNERSFYIRDPSTAVLLLRSGLPSGSHPQTLLYSEARIDPPLRNPIPQRACAPGTGVWMGAYSGDQGVVPTSLNWTTPVWTTIPDTGARTCISRLPNGTLYMLGNAVPVPSHRNILTLSSSDDNGQSWSRVHWIRKETDRSWSFNYPGAAIDMKRNQLWVVYAVNKTQIEANRIQLQ